MVTVKCMGVERYPAILRVLPGVCLITVTIFRDQRPWYMRCTECHSNFACNVAVLSSHC